MSKEKENPNDKKPKRLSFDEWVRTLELKEVKVDCDMCNGECNYDCDECCGDGTVECGKCSVSGLIEDCIWCGDEGGYPDEYPGVESTGWVVCDHCHGDPNKKCDCGGKGAVECEEDGCEGGQVKCGECNGSGSATGYSLKSLDHLEELKDLGIYLEEDNPCTFENLMDTYQEIRVNEDRLIKAHKLERLLA